LNRKPRQLRGVPKKPRAGARGHRAGPQPRRPFRMTARGSRFRTHIAWHAGRPANRSPPASAGGFLWVTRGPRSPGWKPGDTGSERQRTVHAARRHANVHHPANIQRGVSATPVSPLLSLHGLGRSAREVVERYEAVGAGRRFGLAAGRADKLPPERSHQPHSGGYGHGDRDQVLHGRHQPRAVPSWYVTKAPSQARAVM
jgi:hypothetical protein